MFHYKWILKSHANNETASFILQTVLDYFAGSPTSSRGSSATSWSHVCWHVRLFLQLLTGTQVAGRQNYNFFFYPASMYFSLWFAFINKSHDFLAQMQRNSSEAYRSLWQNNMAELSKSFQIFASVLLSKIFQRFAFKIFPAICFQKAFKIFPAVSFQNFSSDLLSNFWTLRDGENLKAHCFQNFVNEN